MRSGWIRLAAVAAVLFLFSAVLAIVVVAEVDPVKKDVSKTGGGEGGVAVVELFTSEGCSSCPPADEVLGEMVGAARKEGTRVFPLAFHVDYWDRLGWKDRFSDAAYSQRQGAYGKALGLRNVYTPQMIVNGTEQFVGSDHAAAKRAVETALEKPATAMVDVKVAVNKSGTYQASFVVTGAEKGAVVNVALVERGLKTNVAAGENSGAGLRHENVVRWFVSKNVTADGKDAVEVPRVEGVEFKNASVIVYVQGAGYGGVAGAGAVDVP